MTTKRILTAVMAMTALAMNAQKQADLSKLSAGLANRLNTHVTGSALSSQHSAAKRQQSILTLLTFNDRRQDSSPLTADYGCRVVDSIGRIFIVDMPLGQVAQISCDPRVERIEAERMPRPAMDVTPAQINATKIYTGEDLPQAFTGKGVAAGVFDSGFDFTHPAFLDADGQLRARYYYDFLWPNADGTLGHALHTTDDIAAYSHSQHVNQNIHGTHVMSIMAGRAVDGKYPGMAPDADLYVADFNSMREDFSNPDAETSAVAVLGFKYLFDRAAQDGKPCVVNFSSCESITLSRQRQLEAEALLQLTGPGRIIVAAAGNDGFRSAYMEKGADDYQAGTGIINGIGSGQIIDLDIVTPVSQEVRFDFLGMKLLGEGIEGTIIFRTDSIDSLQGDTCHLSTTVSMGDVQLSIWRSSYEDPRGTVYHVDGRMPHLAYLVLCGATVLLTGNGPAWLYSDLFFSPFTNITSLKEYSHALPGYNVSWPATLPGIIAVGATGYKETVCNIDGQDYCDMLSFAPDRAGLITKFSSRGPTFDGSIKPDVTAPGLNINAACNSFVDISDNLRKELTDKTEYNGKTYYYTAQSGTSMAAPVVAGTVALWLEAKPDLTPDEVLDVIAHTSTQPDASLTYPNSVYGYGQIDAYRGLLYVLGLQDISGLSQHQPKEVRFRLEGRQLYIEGTAETLQHAELRVYSLRGHLVASTTGCNIDLASLPAGVYAVQLNTGNQQTTGSTLIRL